MNILSYGFKLPQSPDKGSTFFPALEFNINQIATHNHDGNNSAPITSSSITIIKDTTSIIAANWTDVSSGGGTYRQLVNMPAGLNYDNYTIQFKLASNGHPVMLTCEKVSTTSYYVYINDNTQAIYAYYTT